MEHPSLLLDRPNPGSAAEGRSSPWAASPRQALGSDSSAGTTVRFPNDVALVSTRQLRVLCNQAYKLLNSDYPPMEVRGQFEVLAEELERRENAAQTKSAAPVIVPAAPVVPRGTFRNNPPFSRFELFLKGKMAGYVKYEMRGRDVLLVQTIVNPQFRTMDVKPLLIHHVLLNGHRRRLALTPYCPEVQVFLGENPQYLVLFPTRQRLRFEALRAASAAHG